MSLHDHSHGFPSESAIPGMNWDENYVTPAFMGLFPSSIWDERALAHIEEHLAVEAKASASYEAFATAEDPAVSYLAGLIAEDERHHHGVLAKIAMVLRAEVNDVASPVHHVEASDDQRKELLENAKQLLDLEKSDAAALKELGHDLRSAPEETMWLALVEMMALDTEKHIHLLRAIERHLGVRHLVHKGEGGAGLCSSICESAASVDATLKMALSGVQLGRATYRTML